VKTKLSRPLSKGIVRVHRNPESPGGLLYVCRTCGTLFVSDGKAEIVMWEANSHEPTTYTITVCPICFYVDVSIKCPVFDRTEVIAYFMKNPDIIQSAYVSDDECLVNQQ
jgi:hypothetical protein